ncbi:MAG: hypothetical protein SFW09_07700 [Hyphomicrobiaceae bacterium]|nr:hypothetical protein [Hyphomicrobiaceae bacterium]
MRIPAAIALCIAGASICFLSMTIMLDEDEQSWLVAPGTGRTAAFARSAASIASAASAPPPATSRSKGPAIETAGPFPTFVAAGRLSATALAVDAPAIPVRSAHVPPILRRIPKVDRHDPTVAPVAPDAVAEAARTSGAKSTTTRQAARPATFDTSARSALGGPLASTRPR